MIEKFMEFNLGSDESKQLNFWVVSYAEKLFRKFNQKFTARGL